MSFQGMIDYGSYPTPSVLAAQGTYDNMQSTPFDGFVFKLLTNDGVTLSDACWNGVTYTMDDLTDSLAHIRSRNALGWGRTRFPFVEIQIINNANAPVDWFGPHIISALDNLSLIGKFAAEAEIPGIMFDFESYGGINQWNYLAMPLRTQYSLAQYNSQVQNCAEIFVANWRSYNPEMHCMTTNGYERYVNSRHTDPQNWELNKAFLDGMFNQWGYENGRGPGTAGGKIILGTETSYTCLPQACFQNRIDDLDGTNGAAFKGDSPYFGIVNEYMLGMYIDFPDPFDPATPNSNYYTPAGFKTVLPYAADLVDWIFVYNNDYHFSNRSNIIPAVYPQKIFEFRAERGMF